MKRIFISVILISVLKPFGFAFAWNDTLTHPHITFKAVEHSSIDQYLQNVLGLQLGIETILRDREIFKWLQYGAEMEDDPACRASNHFHSN